MIENIFVTNTAFQLLWLCAAMTSLSGLCHKWIIMLSVCKRGLTNVHLIDAPLCLPLIVDGSIRYWKSAAWQTCVTACVAVSGVSLFPREWQADLWLHTANAPSPRPILQYWNVTPPEAFGGFEDNELRLMSSLSVVTQSCQTRAHSHQL